MKTLFVFLNLIFFISCSTDDGGSSNSEKPPRIVNQETKDLNGLWIAKRTNGMVCIGLPSDTVYDYHANWYLTIDDGVVTEWREGGCSVTLVYDLDVDNGVAVTSNGKAETSNSGTCTENLSFGVHPVTKIHDYTFEHLQDLPDYQYYIDHTDGNTMYIRLEMIEGTGQECWQEFVLQ
jgi:hypothetical protein